MKYIFKKMNSIVEKEKQSKKMRKTLENSERKKLQETRKKTLYSRG